MKPRLLDFFCGVYIPQKATCAIIEAWLHLIVSTVVYRSQRQGKAQNGALGNAGTQPKRLEARRGFANTADGCLYHHEKRGSSVLLRVPTEQLGPAKRCGHVVNVAHCFLLEVVRMPIGDIAQKRAPKDLYRKARWHSMSEIRDIWIVFTRRGLPRILACGAKKRERNGSPLLISLGGSASYVE